MTAIDARPGFTIRRTPVGVWLVVFLAIYMLFNAARALADPAGFAAYLGLPLRDAADVGFVQVYALRAAFLGLFAGVLLLRRDLATLKLYALVAMVMPVGDALLVAGAGAPTATVVRHALVAVFLLVTAGMLHRAERRAA